MKKLNLPGLEIIFSDNSNELFDILLGYDTVSSVDKELVDSFTSQKLLIRAIISGDKLTDFSSKADKYTGGQYFTELFRYKFFSVCQNKYLIMVEDPSLSQSLTGTLEDHIISNLNAINA